MILCAFVTYIINILCGVLLCYLFYLKMDQTAFGSWILRRPGSGGEIWNPAYVAGYHYAKQPLLMCHIYQPCTRQGAADYVVLAVCLSVCECVSITNSMVAACCPSKEHSPLTTGGRSPWSRRGLRSPNTVNLVQGEHSQNSGMGSLFSPENLQYLWNGAS